MDQRTRGALELMTALASLGERFAKFSMAVRSEFETVDVAQHMNYRFREQDPSLECYVDAELKDGRAVSWMLDLWWNDEGWRVEAHVGVSDDAGFRIVNEIPERTAYNVEDLLANLRDLSFMLTGSLEWVRSELG